MGNPNLEELTRQYRVAIAFCLGNDLIAPALTIIYSFIDAMGMLARRDLAPDKIKSNSDSFKTWVDEFMLPGSGLGCSAKELWGARCGVLHTLSPQSDQSQHKRAREIYYAVGSAHLSELQAMLKLTGDDHRVVGVQVEELSHAFSVGLHRFFEEIDHDPKLAALVGARLNKVFKHVRAEDLYRAAWQHIDITNS